MAFLLPPVILFISPETSTVLFEFLSDFLESSDGEQELTNIIKISNDNIDMEASKIGMCEKKRLGRLPLTKILNSTVNPLKF